MIYDVLHDKMFSLVFVLQCKNVLQLHHSLPYKVTQEWMKEHVRKNDEDVVNLDEEETLIPE